MSCVWDLMALVPEISTVLSFLTLKGKIKEVEDCRFLVSRTIRQHWTWYSNTGIVCKDIDHILISTRWRLLQNCREFRSAEFLATDYRLVVATLKLHLKSRRVSDVINRDFILKNSKMSVLGNM